MHRQIPELEAQCGWTLATSETNGRLCHRLGTRGDGNASLQKGEKDRVEREKEQDLLSGWDRTRLLPLVKVQDKSLMVGLHPEPRGCIPEKRVPGSSWPILMGTFFSFPHWSYWQPWVRVRINDHSSPRRYAVSTLGNIANSLLFTKKQIRRDSGEGKETQKSCLDMRLTVVSFMVMGLVSRLSLANHFDSGSFLVAHALLSQDGFQ